MSASNRLFVIVSGLPGSGKSVLARRLEHRLNLPVIDKDDILEEQFVARGLGDADWRVRLSRESDAILQRRASASEGAILVSFWHVPGMPAEPGTPTAWLTTLSARVVNVHCVCPPEVAASRFRARQRHPGHLDGRRNEAEVLASIQAGALLLPPALGTRVEVNTSFEPDLDSLVHRIFAALREAEGGVP